MALSHVVSEYSTSKNVVTLKSGSEAVRLGMVSYKCSTVTLSLNGPFFEILDFE